MSKSYCLDLLNGFCPNRFCRFGHNPDIIDRIKAGMKRCNSCGRDHFDRLCKDGIECSRHRSEACPFRHHTWFVSENSSSSLERKNKSVSLDGDQTSRKRNRSESSDIEKEQIEKNEEKLKKKLKREFEKRSLILLQEQLKTSVILLSNIIDNMGEEKVKGKNYIEAFDFLSKIKFD